MKNTIVIWKNIACDRQNSANLENRVLVIYPKSSKNEKLIRGIGSIERNMGLEELEIGERLPIRISTDKKGLIIGDKYFYYMFFGSKKILNHKERIMNNVLKKCSENFQKKQRELIAGKLSRTQLKALYTDVEGVYQSKTDYIFLLSFISFFFIISL